MALITKIPRRRLLKLLISWTLVLSPLLALLALRTFENWRGPRVWRACQVEMAAKGERLDKAFYIPPEVPEMDNFAAAPVILRLFEPDTRPYDPMQNPTTDVFGTNLYPRAEWMLGEDVSLDRWQRYYLECDRTKNNATGTNAAQAVIRVLSRYDPVLDELRHYASRKSARFDQAYTNEYQSPFFNRIPHIYFCRGVVSVLELRSQALLSLGRSDDAGNDVDLILRIAEAYNSMEGRFSHGAKLGAYNRGCTAIWRGLEAHQWDDRQLQRWQRKLGECDLVADTLTMVRAERSRELAECELYETYPSQFFQMDRSANVSRLDRWIFESVFPRGWFQSEKVSVVRFDQECMIDPILRRAADRKSAVEVFAGVDESAKRHLFLGPLEAIRSRRVILFFVSAFSGRKPTFSTAAFSQSEIHLAATACALERHRLTTGSYPETLEALLPSIREDFVKTGLVWEEFKYKPSLGGRYQLYSVGIDGVDDGGKVATKSDGSLDPYSGDWVWPVAKPVESGK